MVLFIKSCFFSFFLYYSFCRSHLELTSIRTLWPYICFFHSFLLRHSCDNTVPCIWFPLFRQVIHISGGSSGKGLLWIHFFKYIFSDLRVYMVLCGNVFFFPDSSNSVHAVPKVWWSELLVCGTPLWMEHALKYPSLTTAFKLLLKNTNNIHLQIQFGRVHSN